jgi:hypothetical protein
MTSLRATAYRRVVKTLRDLGAAKLWPAEQACIREAADALLFCRDLDDSDARRAVAAVTVLTDDLIEAKRWTSLRAMQLLDDIWGCGPSATLDVPRAA